MTKHLHQNVFLTIEMIIRIYYLIGEYSFLFILLEFAHFNKEISNIFY
jgi:hypothetical protein